jgi:four helix bundle protein
LQIQHFAQIALAHELHAESNMSMTPEQMKQRTKQYALRVIRLCQSLEDGWISRTMGQQLLRCGTSVGANYRAACRARSPAECRSKMGIVLEESCFWIEMLADSGVVRANRLADLQKEGNELVAIAVASLNTSRRSVR